MASRYKIFDRTHLELLPLAERIHDLSLDIVKTPKPCQSVREPFAFTADRLVAARQDGATRALMIGAHVLRSGMQRYLFDLMESGLISVIAVNGACAIHDFEFALIGQTTESVARYIRQGRFGLWRETGRLNDIVREARDSGLGLGEAVGKAIAEGDFPYKSESFFAKAYTLDLPVTVHVSIGYDITHEHPNCDGAAYGETSYRDFLIFAECLRRLEDGVVMNFGSAIMAPEVFLKALAMVRNVGREAGEAVRRFAALVCDVKPLPATYATEAPKSDPNYYFRPWKTMLVRTLMDGGESRYVQGLHVETVPELWTALNRLSALTKVCPHD
ncbi:MAG: hypothetical protein AB9872_14950 [Solidesulfovibrio sp.]